MSWGEGGLGGGEWREGGYILDSLLYELEPRPNLMASHLSSSPYPILIPHPILSSARIHTIHHIHHSHSPSTSVPVRNCGGALVSMYKMYK